MSEKIKDVVKATYTKAVESNEGCGCAPTCCSPTQDATFNEDYSQVEGYEEIADYGLGCGLPTEFAKLKTGQTVLDLGSGAGNDVFVARRIVGEGGRVIGVDMTEAMIKKANENKAKLGYTNVDFLLGEIENLPLEDSTVNVAVSNCVMNLVPDKLKAYQELYRVLTPDGHFSISDIVLKGELPAGIRNAAEMYAGCVSGALGKEEYLKVIEDAGFENIEVVKEREIVLPDELLLQFISNEELKDYRNGKSAVLSVTVCADK
jgi:SAM-dependent methyltransferase